MITINIISFFVNATTLLLLIVVKKLKWTELKSNILSNGMLESLKVCDILL